MVTLYAENSTYIKEVWLHFFHFVFNLFNDELFKLRENTQPTFFFFLTFAFKLAFCALLPELLNGLPCTDPGVDGGLCNHDNKNVSSVKP